jgi:Ca-activated chloride channel family protein
MTGRDLENLSKVPVPQPRANAKKAALDAALQAFDAAGMSLPAGSPGGEPEATNKTPQGNVRTLRQTETTQSKRSFRMSSLTRPQMALAASFAALLIVAPVAMHQLRDKNEPQFSPAVSELRAPASESGRIAVTPSIAVDGKDLAMKGAVGGASDGMHVSSGGGKSAPEAPAPFANANVEERAAEMEATTARKGNRKAEVAVTPPSNMPSEVAQGLGQPPAAATRRPITVGKQPLAADNAALGTDYSQSASNADAARTRGDETSIAALAPPPPAPPATAYRANPSAPMATQLNPYGVGAVQNRRLDGLGWMGGEVDADARGAPEIVDLENRDKFEAKEINPVKQVASEPVSTFSIDVDTASYSFVRRALNAGHLPPKDAVRVEELINYFPYAYPAPDTADVPFKPTVSVFDAPWNPKNKLVHVAIKGYDLKTAERPRANLVFLMDVSGSMAGPDRLPLIKNAFRLLVDQLQPDDTIGIVTYASGSGIALEPTKVSEKGKILAAIDAFGAGGSTAGAAGIADAYRLAEAGFDKSAVNRIILATDGDFNVGITDQNELKGFIERKRQSGIFLSILGVGQGNHNDALMQTLAQNGNGTAAYVDTLNEARKVLVDEASSTLFTIAKDVKLQIEWNPKAVSEYRLVGYETRNLRREDFNNDRVDAGDIGSGHTVTAIYEVTPIGAPKLVDDLRYAAKPAANAQDESAPASATEPASNELGFLKLRYKRPREDVSNLIELPIMPSGAGLDGVAADVRFSTAVAAFGQLLKGESYTQGYSFDDVLKLAQGARGDDPFGYRAEFLNLVRLAKSARP